MVQSLELGTTNRSADDKGMKRLNRMPLFFGIGILVLFLAVLVYGLSSRGLRFGQPNSNENGSSTPASTFADQLKRGVKDGIIGDLEETPQVFQPTPVSQRQDTVQTLEVESKVQPREDRRPRTETVNRRRNGTPYRLPKGTPASSCIGSARVGPGLSI